MLIILAILKYILYFGIALGFLYLFAPDIFMLIMFPFGVIAEAKQLNKEMEEDKKHPTKPIRHLIPEKHIGTQAITLRPLGPSGQIQVDNEKFEAISDMGFIDKDTQVEIAGIRHHQ